MSIAILISFYLNNLKTTKVVRNIIGISEDGFWHHVYNEDTGKTTYVPIDPDYFNTYYHANQKLITCDSCGCVVLNKSDTTKELCSAD